MEKLYVFFLFGLVSQCLAEILNIKPQINHKLCKGDDYWYWQWEDCTPENYDDMSFQKAPTSYTTTTTKRPTTKAPRILDRDIFYDYGWYFGTKNKSEPKQKQAKQITTTRSTTTIKTTKPPRILDYDYFYIRKKREISNEKNYKQFKILRSSSINRKAKTNEQPVTTSWFINKLSKSQHNISTAAVNEATTRISTTTVATSKPEVVQRCITDCPATREYNPVCGSNNQTYYNIGRLACARSCGVDVTLVRAGRCPGSTGQLCVFC